MALMAVGNAWDIEYYTDDKEWNKRASEFMREMYYPTADITRKDDPKPHYYMSRRV